jgi:hypothetical protein
LPCLTFLRTVVFPIMFSMYLFNWVQIRNFSFIWTDWGVKFIIVLIDMCSFERCVTTAQYSCWVISFQSRNILILLMFWLIRVLIKSIGLWFRELHDDTLSLWLNIASFIDLSSRRCWDLLKRWLSGYFCLRRRIDN